MWWLNLLYCSIWKISHCELKMKHVVSCAGGRLCWGTQRLNCGYEGLAISSSTQQICCTVQRTTSEVSNVGLLCCNWETLLMSRWEKSLSKQLNDTEWSIKQGKYNIQRSTCLAPGGEGSMRKGAPHSPPLKCVGTDSMAALWLWCWSHCWGRTLSLSLLSEERGLDLSEALPRSHVQ